MKNKALTIAVLLLTASCQEGDREQIPTSTGRATVEQELFGAEERSFISVEEGNVMIKSYLNSIDYGNNDTDLRSLIYDADSLRTYLADTSIKKLKLMFAHTPEFIDGHEAGASAGYRSGWLTMVFAGYDRNGNYRLYDGSLAFDRALPCPANCPVAGTAARDTLIGP